MRHEQENTDSALFVKAHKIKKSEGFRSVTNLKISRLAFVAFLNQFAKNWKIALPLKNSVIHRYGTCLNPLQTGESSMWNPRVITTDAIQIFLSRGGTLLYKPKHSPNGWVWELWGVHPEGREEPIISGKSGETRVFKSADAVCRFHARIFPTATVVPVPILPQVDTEAGQPDDE